MHCKGQFVASDRMSQSFSHSDSGLALLRRTDEIRELAEKQSRTGIPPHRQQAE